MSNPIEQIPGRRKFIASLGVIGALAGIRPVESYASTFSQTEQIEGDLFRCKPYLQAAHKDRITIRWITSVPCHSWVEYGTNPGRLDKKAQQVEEGMIQVDNTVHAITLNDLQQGQSYHYRVVSRETESMERKQQAFGVPVYSEVYHFATIPEDQEAVEFSVLNDIHDRPESFAAVLKYKESERKDFVFLNGDMFNKQEDEGQIIRHLIDPITADFASTTPFFLGRGNHETWGPFARDLSKYIDGRENKYYYSFRYGPMAGIVLDSGETKPDEDPVNGGIIDFDSYRKEQGRWLARELQKESIKSANYKIVFIHIPAYYTGSELHASGQYNKIWGPLLNEAKIDLMLCGHTHSHGVHKAVMGEHNYPIVIGGGPKDGKRTIINIKVTQSALNLRMLNDSGELVGSLNL